MVKSILHTMTVSCLLVSLVFIGGTYASDKKNIASKQKTAAKGKAISWVYDFNEGLQRAKKENKPIMIDFYADWCGWCHKLDEVPYKDTAVIELSTRMVCIKINTDTDQETPARYGVQGLPTIVFLNSQGKGLGKIVGYRDSEYFIKAMSLMLKEQSQ